MSFELCKKLLSSYVVAPIVKLLYKRLQPCQLHLFFFNLEDNKIVITYPLQRCRKKEGIICAEKTENPVCRSHWVIKREPPFPIWGFS